jgi:hypothetical protein
MQGTPLCSPCHRLECVSDVAPRVTHYHPCAGAVACVPFSPAPAQVCGGASNLLSPFLRPSLMRLEGCPGARARVMPHTKAYVRRVITLGLDGVVVHRIFAHDCGFGHAWVRQRWR